MEDSGSFWRSLAPGGFLDFPPCFLINSLVSSWLSSIFTIPEYENTNYIFVSRSQNLILRLISTKREKMVHLLSISQLRILSGVLCFISIGAIVAHALIFILLMSHMDAMTVPYSLMGQGVWTGSITIGTATLLLSYSNAKSKEWM